MRSTPRFPAVINTQHLDGNLGFQVRHKDPKQDNSLSLSLANLGDINNDGRPDYGISAPYAGFGGVDGVGLTYVLFGSPGLKDTQGVFYLDDLEGQNGFVFVGPSLSSYSGAVVSSPGDLNGDSINDILILDEKDTCYLIWGNERIGTNGLFELSRLFTNPELGCTFSCLPQGGAGSFKIGDVDGSGYDDLLVQRPDGGYYLYQGGPNFCNDITNNLKPANQSVGFELVAFPVETNWVWSGIGDRNGDGIDDFAIAVESDKLESSISAGVKIYVIDGGNFSSIDLYLNQFNVTHGLRLEDAYAGEITVKAIAGYGDFNGDGFSDLLYGAPYHTDFQRQESGRGYLYYGSNTSSSSMVVSLNSIKQPEGLVFFGQKAKVRIGTSIAFAGDIDGNGLNDVVLGGSQGKSINHEEKDESAVVLAEHFTEADQVDLNHLNGTNGFLLTGFRADSTGRVVIPAGDMNQDGVDDFMVAAPWFSYKTDSIGALSGKAYAFFGDIAPTLTRLSLRIREGETIVLDLNNLNVSDPNHSAEQLRFFIDVSNLRVLVRSEELTSLANFTQQAVINRWVRLQHNGGEGWPAINVSVCSGWMCDGPYHVKINYIPNNDLPVVRQATISINNSQTIILGPESIYATDEETLPSQLRMGFVNVTRCNLFDARGVSLDVSNFPQQTILDRHLRLHHDGSNIHPTLTLTIDDGQAEITQPVAVIFDGELTTQVNDRPKVRKNQFWWNQGGSILISGEELDVWDPDNLDSELTVFLSNIAHCHFENTDQPDERIDHFTISEKNNRKIKVYIEETPDKPGFTFRVSDGRLTTTDIIANIQYNSAPLLGNHRITVRPGQSGILSRAHISALDSETPVEKLSALFSGLQHIELSRVDQPDLPVSLLQLNEIMDGRIQYRVDQSNSLPSAYVAITDGDIYTQPKPMEITFLRDNLVFQQDEDFTEKYFYSVGSTLLSILVTVMMYFFLRRSLARHRNYYPLANHLRKILNLSYFDFNRLTGDVFSDRVKKIQSELCVNHNNFYYKLKQKERKSFAVCMAEIILSDEKLCKKEDGVFGCFVWVLCFSRGWPYQLDLNLLEERITEIVSQSVAAWAEERAPTQRWKMNQYGRCDKIKTYFTPCKSGLFSPNQGGVELGETVKREEKGNTDASSDASNFNHHSI